MAWLRQNPFLTRSTTNRKRAIAEAEAELDAGKGIPHEKVREWLLKLARGEIIPPPCE
jgi:predicted transcriptional regulator